MTKANKQKTRKRRRLVLTVVIGLVVVGLFVAALIPKRLPVDMVTVEQGDVLVTVDEDGQTRVKDRYIVDAPLDGHVGRIELDAGDPVQEGAVVARIVPLSPPLLDARTKAEAEARLAAAKAAKRQAGATIARAQAAMQLASLEAERQANLGPSGATSLQAVEQADARRIYLFSEPHVLHQHIQADAGTAANRPNLTAQGGGLAEIEAVLAERDPVYRAVADVTFDMTHLNIEDGVRYLIERCLR